MSSDDKVTRIFKFFDKDGDDVLNYSEMDQLMRTISVPPRKLEYLQWVEVCQFWRADHRVGLPLRSLMAIYNSSPGSIDDEYVALLPAVAATVTVAGAGAGTGASVGAETVDVAVAVAVGCRSALGWRLFCVCAGAVSYTHLTLPTIYSV